MWPMTTRALKLSFAPISPRAWAVCSCSGMRQHSNIVHCAHSPKRACPSLIFCLTARTVFPSLTADREDAGFRATRHLIQLGHRHIGFIGDLETRPKTTLRKLAGYRRALESAELPYVEDCIQNVIEFG